MHILKCADLMSGGGAPVSCRNDRPNATGAATVNSRFASLSVTVTADRELVHVD